MERVNGMEEEEVEGRHARDGNWDGIRQAPQHRCRQHREQVEDAEAQDGHGLAEREDRRGDDCDGRRARSGPHRYPGERADG
jgi:hypothetical protein